MDRLPGSMPRTFTPRVYPVPPPQRTAGWYSPDMFASLVFVGSVYAASVELVVVGVHAPGIGGDPAQTAARKLTEALDATGKVDALSVDEVRTRLAGREPLILDSFALGPGRDALKEGKVLYDRAQPDQAIPVLEQAARQLASGLATSTDVRDLHDALTLLGLANAGLGNQAAARAAFRRSVTLDPTRQLDAVNYPPQIVALFQEVRTAAGAEAPGIISLSPPAGAEVWIDGRQLLESGEVKLIPGEHHVLVKGGEGTGWFESVTLGPGERRALAPGLSPRTMGRAAADAPGRTRQTRDLYRSLGQYTDRDPILLAGLTATGQVAVQIYAPASGNFSRALTAEAGSDPVAAMVDLMPSLVGFIGDNGDVKSDRVSPQVVAFDVTANAVLSDVLFRPRAPAVAGAAAAGTKKKGVPWFVWAGIGAVAVGGGTTAAVLLTQPTDTGGTVTFGPLP